MPEKADDETAMRSRSAPRVQARGRDRSTGAVMEALVQHRLALLFELLTLA